MSDVMKGRPLKFRLLEIFYHNEPMWNYDVVAQIMEEYGMKSDFMRDSVNFDIIEVQMSGFIESTGCEVDVDGKFREGALLRRFRITDLGRSQYEELARKVRK